jgi:exopolysaccharide production protein ExoQ
MEGYPAVGGGIAARAEALLEADGIGRRERRLRLCEGVSTCLFVVCILYIFDMGQFLIGDQGHDPASGSIVNRIFWLTILAAGAVILLVKLPLALRVLVSAWPTMLILAWFAASTYWADYPGLAVRRVLAFAVVYVAALGLAVGLRSPRSLQIGLLVAFGLVLVADLLSLGVPSYSQTPIGMQGIHVHKNSAGLIAVLAFVGIVFALPRLRSFVLKAGTAGLALWCLVFLYLTLSKTSFGTMAVVVALLPLYHLWLRSGRIRLAYVNIAVALVSFAVFAAATAGVTMAEVGLSVTGDLTFTSRTDIWNAVLDKIAQSPRFGFGFGSIWDVGAKYNPFGGPEYEFWNNPEIINQAHNGYLDLLLHGGIVALALALLVALRALWLSSVLASHPAVPLSHRYVFCMLHAFIVVILLNNLLESSLFFPSSSRSYFFLFIITQLDRWKADLDVYRSAMRRTTGDPLPA